MMTSISNGKTLLIIACGLVAMNLCASPVSAQVLREVTVFERGEKGYHTFCVPVGVVGGKNLSDGQWHRVVAVRDTDAWELRIYVDGRLAGKTSDVTHDDLSNDSDLRIGAFNNSRRRQFRGDIELVRIYDAALDEGRLARMRVARSSK